MKQKFYLFRVILLIKRLFLIYETELIRERNLNGHFQGKSSLNWKSEFCSLVEKPQRSKLTSALRGRDEGHLELQTQALHSDFNELVKDID